MNKIEALFCLLADYLRNKREHGKHGRHRAEEHAPAVVETPEIVVQVPPEPEPEPEPEPPEPEPEPTPEPMIAQWRTDQGGASGGTGSRREIGIKP